MLVAPRSTLSATMRALLALRKIWHALPIIKDEGRWGAAARSAVASTWLLLSAINKWASVHIVKKLCDHVIHWVGEVLLGGQWWACGCCFLQTYSTDSEEVCQFVHVSKQRCMTLMKRNTNKQTSCFCFYFLITRTLWPPSSCLCHWFCFCVFFTCCAVFPTTVCVHDGTHETHGEVNLCVQ